MNYLNGIRNESLPAFSKPSSSEQNKESIPFKILERASSDLKDSSVQEASQNLGNKVSIARNTVSDKEGIQIVRIHTRLSREERCRDLMKTGMLDEAYEMADKEGIQIVRIHTRLSREERCRELIKTGMLDEAYEMAEKIADELIRNSMFSDISYGFAEKGLFEKAEKVAKKICKRKDQALVSISSSIFVSPLGKFQSIQSLEKPKKVGPEIENRIRLCNEILQNINAQIKSSHQIIPEFEYHSLTENINFDSLYPKYGERYLKVMENQLQISISRRISEEVAKNVDIISRSAFLGYFKVGVCNENADVALLQLAFKGCLNASVIGVTNISKTAWHYFVIVGKRWEEMDKLRESSKDKIEIFLQSPELENLIVLDPYLKISVFANSVFKEHSPFKKYIEFYETFNILNLYSIADMENARLMKDNAEFLYEGLQEKRESLLPTTKIEQNSFNYIVNKRMERYSSELRILLPENAWGENRDEGRIFATFEKEEAERIEGILKSKKIPYECQQVMDQAKYTIFIHCIDLNLFKYQPKFW